MSAIHALLPSWRTEVGGGFPKIGDVTDTGEELLLLSISEAKAPSSSEALVINVGLYLKLQSGGSPLQLM